MKNLATLFTLLLFAACSNDPIQEAVEENDNFNQGQAFTANLNLPDILHNYTDLDLPEHFVRMVSEIDNTPNNNLVTDAGATLGRVLFTIIFYQRTILLPAPLAIYNQMAFRTQTN